MHELNIDTFCANSSSAKVRLERAHLTLQDPFVKQLRLRGISTAAEANAGAPSFMDKPIRRSAKSIETGVSAFLQRYVTHLAPIDGISSTFTPSLRMTAT